MPVISGEDYLTIAEKFAEAYETQLQVVYKFYDAVQALKCLDDIEVTVDLLGEFHTAYTINKGRLESTQPFEAAVLKLQQHITRESGKTVDEFIASEVAGAVVPEAWGKLSAAVGYPISALYRESNSSNSSSS